MTNVIRPTFGSKPRREPEAPEPAADPPLRVYGEAAGHRVTLVADPAAPVGAVLKVVVAPLFGGDAEPVALLPQTPDGAVDADIVGMAVLRTLELIEAGDPPPSNPPGRSAS